MKKFFILLFILCSGVQSVYAERARTNSGKLPNLIQNYNYNTNDWAKLNHEIKTVKDRENSDPEKKAKLLAELEELLTVCSSYIDEYSNVFDGFSPHRLKIEEALEIAKGLSNEEIASIINDLRYSLGSFKSLFNQYSRKQHEKAAEKIGEEKDHFTRKISRLGEQWLEHKASGGHFYDDGAWLQMFDLSNQADKILETSDLSNQA